MANMFLGFDNQVSGATLTEGSWNSDLPRANLQHEDPTTMARTSNAAAASTKLRFALASPMHLAMVALINTNASVDASYRLQLYSDSGFTTSIYDSGTVDVYPMGTIPYGDIPWGAPNWWTGRPLPAELDRFQRNIRHELSDWQYAQYGQLEIFDTANADGYFEAGRLFIGQGFRPERNASYGAGLQINPRSTILRTLSGGTYALARQPDFSIPVAFEMLTPSEGMRALDIQAAVDLHGECYFEWDTEDPAYWFRKSVFGRLAKLDLLRFPMVLRSALSFQVEGNLW